LADEPLGTAARPRGRAARDPLRQGRLPGAAPEAAGPLLLALETATSVMSVALARGPQLIAEISTRDARLHSERLLPAIDQLLALANVSLDAVEAFAISIGPGSFTGLRIGLATLKGLAFGDDRPVVPVPTLLALCAGAVGAPGPVAALLDARRGELYAAAVERAGDREAALLEESVFRVADLASRLPKGCTLVMGEGTEFARVELGHARPDLVLLPEASGQARAAPVAALGMAALGAGGPGPVSELLPRYLRRAEAEALRTGHSLEPRDGEKL
jgi:tRNA threonylcarbamoyl adenosine modification protein YeaZ